MSLEFYYGTMNTSKTPNLLMQRFSMVKAGIDVLLLKPTRDSRGQPDKISTKIGNVNLCADAWPLEPSASINEILLVYTKENKSNPGVIMVDEAEFLTKRQVNELRLVVDNMEIDVKAFGLLTDSTSELFEGSKRLVEISDNIVRVGVIYDKDKKICIVNARLDDEGRVTLKGDQVLIGDVGKEYKVMNYKDWIMHCEEQDIV